MYNLTDIGNGNGGNRDLMPRPQPSIDEVVNIENSDQVPQKPWKRTGKGNWGNRKPMHNTGKNNNGKQKANNKKGKPKGQPKRVPKYGNNKSGTGKSENKKPKNGRPWKVKDGKGKAENNVPEEVPNEVTGKENSVDLNAGIVRPGKGKYGKGKHGNGRPVKTNAEKPIEKSGNETSGKDNPGNTKSENIIHGKGNHGRGKSGNPVGKRKHEKGKQGKRGPGNVRPGIGKQGKWGNRGKLGYNVENERK